MERGLQVLVIVVLMGVAMSGCFQGRSAGSAAEDFINGRIPKMVVEIDAESGKELSGSSVDLLRTRIHERLDKPGGVTYHQSTIGVSRQTWSVGDLKDAEDTHRDDQRGADTIALYVLVVGGGYEKDTQDGRVLGVAYGPSSIAIFKDNIQSAGVVGGIPLFSTAQIEQAVLIHEFGHILGLVNIGLDMVTPHEMTQDPVSETPQNEGRGHSDNKESVMYWAVESSLLSDVFNGPPPNNFDANDIADMRAVGGK